MDREPEPYPKGIAVSHHTQKIDHLPQLDYRFEKALITRAVGPSVLVKDHLNLVMFLYRFGQSNCTIDSTIHKVWKVFRWDNLGNALNPIVLVV